MKIQVLAFTLIAAVPAASSAQSSWIDLRSMAGGESAAPPVQTAPAQGAKPSAGAAAQAPAAPDRLAALKERIAKASEARPLFIVAESDHEGRLRKYLVIQKAQLEAPYLFSSTLERGLGERGAMSTLMDATFLASFRLVGEKAQLLRRQMDYRADDGTPELKAIEKSIPDDILAVVPIKASDTVAGYWVVSADELFLQDLTKVGLRLQRLSPGKVLRFDPAQSTLERIASFPRNVEVQAQLLFAQVDPSAPAMAAGVLALTMRYSLTALHEAGSFEPRPADPRVGYFTTSFQDLGRPDLKDRVNPAVHWANRWRLEKKEPDAPVSEVKKPIVFWLEDTVPEEYRPALRAGILAWNEAFEAVGFKGAVVVKQVPATGTGNEDMSAEERASFDPADIAYNMVRWFVGKNAGFAVGPSRVDPRTGEILHASISVGDMIARIFGWLDLAPARPAPAAAWDDEEALERLAQEAAAGLALAEARGPLPPAERQRYRDELLAHIIGHEVGHTLGLRHNFKASQLLAQEELGLGGRLLSSLMDYAPPHIAPAGKPQGAYFQTRVGEYDRWAIEYGYRPLPVDKEARKKELDSVAARSASDPALAYGTDEEADDSDPDTQRFDMGRGALPFAKARTELAKELWRRLEGEADPNEDPKRLKEKFGAGFSAYRNAVQALLPTIGGVRTRRGPGTQFEPVPASEQREALRFLEENVFRAEAFQFSPKLLRGLGNDRQGYPALNPPYPIVERVGELQKAALSHLFSPEVLRRLADREVYADEPGGRFTPSEMMDRVRRSVWSELWAKKPEPIHLYRRRLQDAHLEALTRTLKDGEPEGQAAARRDLERLSRDIKKGLDRHKDETSRLHLRQMLSKATAALESPKR